MWVVHNLEIFLEILVFTGSEKNIHQKGVVFVQKAFGGFWAISCYR